MRNDTINNLLLLYLTDIVNVARLMQLRLAPSVTFVALKHCVDANVLLAARVLIL